MNCCNNIIQKNILKLKSNCDQQRRVESWNSKFISYTPNNNWDMHSGVFCSTNCRVSSMKAAEHINVLFLKLQKCPV